MSKISNSVWPDWVTPDVRDALLVLPTYKHINTVVLLAEASLDTDVSMGQVFEREDTCHRSTWYARTVSSKRGPRSNWADNQDVVRAMELCKAAAKEYAVQQMGRHIEASVRVLTELGPVAAASLAGLIDWEDPEIPHEVRRKAACDILDRIGAGATASTSNVRVGGAVAVDDVSELSDEELDRRLAALLGASFVQVGETDPPGPADGEGEEDDEEGGPGGRQPVHRVVS